MKMVLIRLEVRTGEADFATQQRRLGIGDDEADAHFGLRRIDPRNGIYAMKVAPAAAARVAHLPGVSGAYANPAISPVTSDD